MFDNFHYTGPNDPALNVGGWHVRTEKGRPGIPDTWSAYQPNGGWGAPGPKLDTTSWRSSRDGDRVTRATNKTLAGWHVLMLTAANGVVTYSIDDNKVFTSDGAAR